MNRNSNEPTRQTISMTTLRVKTREVVEKAYYAQNVFIVKAYDRPMVAIIGIAQFEALVAMAASHVPQENKAMQDRNEHERDDNEGGENQVA